ncbi:cobalamin biosynthesis protein CbiL [Desulfovibrio intestinalis]|uniref:Nickel transport protein n=1 Tax=Desulfovibrio intestinalis TaxID=58621 RepID=A0A7W8BZ89_9BACT|nr:cobalamin biosynthesis protein CbiL [Desulfovibrio intestinalis]MBB5142673.1 nickel transport protein [Desulfovibrio intestinalis]
MFYCRHASAHAASTSCHTDMPCGFGARPCLGALAPLSTSLVILVLTTALLLLFQVPAMAHRVNIFAWTEGPQVIVKCGFSGGNSVKNGDITVYDAATEKVLLQGRTNAEGLFRFDIPPAGKEHGLRIRINAGEGHQNEWQMDAAELAQAPATTTASAAAGVTGEATGGPTPALPQNAGDVHSPKTENAKSSQPALLLKNSGAPATDPQISGSGPASAEEVRSIVDAALNAQTEKFNALLDARLSPLRRQLAEMRTEGPGVREIVGGMGWFVGLAGLALYFRSRRR